VAVVGKKERYAWPGANEFSDTDIREFMGHGSILTGDFAGFVKGVFVTDQPAYTYAGETTLKARRAKRYDYTVLAEHSGFRVRFQKLGAAVAYHGSFWADAESLDVLRLDVEASVIPGHLPIRRVSSTIQYAPVRIGDSEFWLPQSTATTVLFRSGARNRNNTAYTACHQYVGKSTIRFGEAEQDPAAPSRDPAQSAARELPAGLKMDAELQEPIRISDCAIGDPVTLALVSPASLGDFSLPQGTLLYGRIVRMNDSLTPMRYATLALRIPASQFGGARVEFQPQLNFVPNGRWKQLRVESPGPETILLYGERQHELPKGSRFFFTTTPRETP
jgi:hypothetical protein